MTITLGQLVSELYDVFERRFHDRELAARATQMIVNDLLCRGEEKKAAPAAPRRRATRPAARPQPMRRAA
jgi:hypothetical protein